MEKRYIGIDIDSRCVRVAVASQDDRELLAVLEKPYAGPEELLAALREILGDTRLFGDRVAAAIPAGEGFVRTLRFPFADPKKIESTLRFELSTQIPITIDDCTADFRKPQPEGEGLHAVAAAAVRTDYLQRTVETFDQGGILLHIVDLAPFAQAAGLRRQIGDGILACLGEEESTVSLVQEGQVSDYRLIPHGPRPAAAEIVHSVLRESRSLPREARHRDLQLYLIGPGVTAEVQEALRAAAVPFAIPAFIIDGWEVPPSFLPAVALALRAAIPTKEKEFNFRQGRFALKNEWAALKKELTAAAAVLLLSVAVLAGSAWLKYDFKADQAQILRQEMSQTFQQTFNRPPATRDIPVEMRSQIKALTEKARLVGVGGQSSPLRVLQEISRNIPAAVKVDIRDLNYSPETVRLEGHTTSFDAINQMARNLEKSPLFKEVQIADAKMSLDGSRVDFRLTLSFRTAKESR